MKKILCFTVILFAITAISVAQTVNIKLLWDSPAADTEVLPYLEAMVGGCLMQLFESGYMGTNSIPTQSNKQAFVSMKATSDDTEAFIDFDVIIYIELPDVKVKPTDVQYKVLNVASGKEIHKGKIIVPALSAASRQEYMQYYHALGVLLIKDFVSRVSMYF